MFVYLDTAKIKLIRNKDQKRKIKRKASGCKGNFCQCKTEKYFQIWLLPRFDIMSEKCIKCRPLKHQKKLKIVRG